MKGVARSFWTLVFIVALAEAYLVYVAVNSLHNVLPCWWSFIPHPANSPLSCGESVAIFGYQSWVPASVILVLFLLTLTVAIVTLASQILRTRHAVGLLGEAIEKPDVLVEAERDVGIAVSLIADERSICCCAGVLAPRVILSTGMLNLLDESQVRAVLAHEAEHARRRDPARAAAVTVAANAFFYVPLVRHLARKSLVAAELGADASAANVAGQRALVEALLRVLGQTGPALRLAIEMASLDALDLRIATLQTKAIPRVRPSPIVVVGSLLAAVAMWGLSQWLPPTVKAVEFHPVAPQSQWQPRGAQRALDATTR